MQEPHLLVTKFTIPPLRAHLLPRALLIERLNQNCMFPLLLISAGAGFGKTTLLATWANQNAHPVVWLTLDRLDNDPSHFWRAMIAALRTRLPTAGEEVLTLLRSPQPPRLSVLSTLLINELTTLDEETMLILDDYHMIEEQTIHESLMFLLDHAPICLHLMIASRVDPPLPLSRWRVRGQLAEIRNAEMRLTEVETTSFLRDVMGVQLRKEEVRRLAERTEGWIAGLQLAALSLRGHVDPSAFVKAFSGSQRFILDYVQEEILAHQPLAIQRFLMQTAILNRMNAALCQAVTSEQNSQAILERLERANLFLVPLDEERRWYSLHDLIRSAMLARLQMVQPEMVPLLHQRAAEWYEAQSQWREAISHRLAAADFSYAACLLERTIEQFWLRGETQMMYHWVMALPDAVVRGHARFVLTAALYLLSASDHTVEAQISRARTQAEHLMARVAEAALLHTPATEEGQQVASLLPATELTLLHQRMRMLQLFIELIELELQGNWQRFPLIDQQMQQLNQEDELIWRMLSLSVAVSARFTTQGEGALLVPELLAAQQQASNSGNRFALMKVRQWLVLAFRQAGRLRQMYWESQEALALLEQTEGQVSMAGYFSMSLAFALYEWNRLEEARPILRKMFHDAVAWQQVDLQRWGYLLLGRLEVAAGDLTAAHQILREGERLPIQRHLRLMAGIRALWWLEQGDLASASDWAAQIVFHQDTWNYNLAWEFFALIRVYFAQQRYGQAVETLERWSSYLDRPGNIYTTIYFLSLHAVALYQAGKRVSARAIALRLFSLTEPEGYIRVYLDTGEPMKQTLQSLLTTTQDPTEGTPVLPHAYILRLLAAFEQEEQRHAVKSDAPSARPPAVLPLVPQPRSGSPSSVPSLLEPLTPQEHRVLRLLGEGASNQQIADQLVVELSTAKKHVGNLLSKLGVSSRTQAIVRARESSLL